MAQELLTCPIDEFAALSNTLLSNGRRVRFQVRGTSMWPAIKDGDLVEVEPVSVADLRIGGVVLVRTPSDRLLVHRVVQIVGTGRSNPLVITQGDTSTRTDEPTPTNGVLGKVVAVENGGYREHLAGCRSATAGRVWAWVMHRLLTHRTLKVAIFSLPRLLALRPRLASGDLVERMVRKVRRH